MASLFDTLQAGAYRANIVPRTEKSRNWFRARVKELGTVSRQKIMSDPNLKVRTEPKIGDMCMYVYDPKGKADLPYYDMFPLSIMVQPAKGGFHGLNLHYLPLRLRARLMDALYDTVGSDGDQFQITYNILNKASKLRFFKPCVKHYLFGHVKSRFFYIDPKEWDIALFLPTERFVKANKARAHRDSIARI